MNLYNNLKKKLKRLKRNLGALPPIVSSVIKFSNSKIRIITYHGISSSALSILEFEKQLKFISNHFDNYWVSEIPHLLNTNIKSKPKIILTFDDGLKNHITNVVPLLKKYNLKSTFYVPINLIEENKFLWNHELKCLLMSMENNNLPKNIQEIIGSCLFEKENINDYIEKIKKLNHEYKINIIEELKRNNKIIYEQWMLEEYQLMNLNDLINISSLVEIGSHTLNHPILTTISKENLIEEIRESRFRLEKFLNKPVVSFCYPNGIYSDEIINIVKNYYPIGVSTDEGFVTSRDNISILKRIPAGKNMQEFLLRLIKPTS
jgi:peptidoglycan/xylan/chitin deacetylase (PgdA/CDA1 family)